MTRSGVPRARPAQACRPSPSRGGTPAACSLSNYTARGKNETGSCRPSQSRQTKPNRGKLPRGFWPTASGAERLLADRLRETEEELERMRDQLSKEKAKKKPKTKPKKSQKPKSKVKKDFVIPETSEIVDYIKEKGIDEKLKIPAEVIAESFRSVYEKEEDTGEKDDSGAPICRTVWRKANGNLVENWKSCLQTFKARQLVWDAKQGEKPAKKPFNNQFNQFEQNEYTDEELDEIINSSVS